MLRLCASLLPTSLEIVERRATETELEKMAPRVAQPVLQPVVGIDLVSCIVSRVLRFILSTRGWLVSSARCLPNMS